ncbi:MAG TPA: hypothetical protein PKA44_09305 [Saprospiraceae bacterium]|nr:hypothetical protein [Saprospiraceae bacterium]
MKIELKRNHGYYLIIEADNVKIQEDIETREYPKDENGKTIINLNPKRDICTNALDQIARLLDDMIEYREADYDSSELIKRLFSKLPSEVAMELSGRITADYTY